MPIQSGIYLHRALRVAEGSGDMVIRGYISKIELLKRKKTDDFLILDRGEIAERLKNLSFVPET